MHEHAHHRRNGHGRKHDQGMAGSLRYLRLLPAMWRSPVSSVAVGGIGPKAGERVVDLGAGMRAATVEAVLTGASVVAVDPTPLMRAILQARRWWPGRGNLLVLAGTAESMPCGP
jgi:precorrin-6B methylase 2